MMTGHHTTTFVAPRDESVRVTKVEATEPDGDDVCTTEVQ